MTNSPIETGNSAEPWQWQAFADTVFLATEHGMPLPPETHPGHTAQPLVMGGYYHPPLVS